MNSSGKVLQALLFIDALMVLLYGFYQLDLLQGRVWRLNYDGSVSEYFQYAKLALASMALFTLAFLRREPLLWFWSAVAAFLCLDDALRIHEQFGGTLLGNLLSNYSDAHYHLGQALYGVIVAALILGVGAYFWSGAQTTAKQLSLRLVASLGVLWLCAVVVDFVHGEWVPTSLNWLGVVVEEGGELLAGTFFVWFCYRELASEHQRLHGPDVAEAA